MKIVKPSADVIFHYPSKTQLRKWFTYDSETGRLINRINRSHINKKGKDPNRITIANGIKYVMIGIKGRDYYAHRLVWIYHNGAIPKGKQIDHIDHDGTNNRIDNLRVVSRAENHRNMRMYSRNRSGVNGISWYKQLCKWRVQIKVNSKIIHIGFFYNIDDAIEARLKADKKYGFHKNHGK